MVAPEGPVPSTPPPRAGPLRRGILGSSLSELGPDAAIALVITAFVLLVSNYEGSAGWWQTTLKPLLQLGPSRFEHIAPFLWWYGSSVGLYLLLPCVVSAVTGRPPLRQLGFGLGERKLGFGVSAVLVGVMLPLVFEASRFSDFRQAYPLASEALESREAFIAYELAYVAYFISWEFLFRGYLLQSLRPQVGNGAAVFVQMVPFALMHMGKPEAEAYGSVVAGLALGILAVRTGTFWYGAFIHAAIAFAMDCFCGRSRLHGDAAFQVVIDWIHRVA